MPPQNFKTYKVQKGEDIFSIAKKHNIAAANISGINNFKNGVNQELKEGLEIKIPINDSKPQQSAPVQQWNTKTYSAEDKKRLKDQFKQSERGQQIQNSTDYMQQRWQNSQSYQDVQAKTNSQGWKDMQKKMNVPKTPTPIPPDPVPKAKGTPWMTALSMRYNQYKDNSAKRKEENTRQKLLNDQRKAEKQRLKELRKGMKGDEEGVNSGSLVAVLLISLIVHYFDARTAFFRVGPAYIIPSLSIVLAYVFLLVIGWLFVFKNASERESFGLWVLGGGLLVPTLLNHLYNMVPSEWMKVALGLAGWLPVVSLYIISKFSEENAIKKLMRFYYFFWIMAGLTLILSSSMMREQASTAFGEGGILLSPATSMEYTMKTAWGAIQKSMKEMTKTWDQGIAKATGQTYSSEEEEQRGIYLEEVRPIEPMYYTDSDVYIQAKLKAKNILQYIPVKTTCNVPDTAITGVVTPEIKNLVNDEETYIDCHLRPLPAGSYAVTLTSTFTFETDADIQYYFVDNATRPELYTDMKIPERTTAIYGGGPVAVGLLSFHQPMRVSSTYTTNDVGDYSFGVRLENKWSQGKIIKGNYYILEVPNSVKLENCNRKQSTEQGYPKANGERTQYKFIADNNNLKEVFDSVSCRIIVTDPTKLFGADIVAQKTFSAKVNYEYAIEQSTSVNVGTG